MDLEKLERISQIIANLAIIGTFAIAAIETWEKRKSPEIVERVASQDDNGASGGGATAPTL